MKSYQYQNDLFKAVLSKSKAIEGRFFICPDFGAEINSDQLGEVLNELVEGSMNIGQRYPMVLAMPPRSNAPYTRADGWEDYQWSFFFLKQSYVDSQNNIQDLNHGTNTSMHTIVHDWTDMKRPAVNFMRALDNLQRRPVAGAGEWRLAQGKNYTSPVTKVGNDHASGVRLDFTLQIFIGCDLEDYTQEDIDGITIPTIDSHPEHNL